MKKILILFAHPRYENSRANRALLEPLHDLKQVTIHDLYEQYPNFNISIVQEQQLLLSHQIKQSDPQQPILFEIAATWLTGS